MRAHEGLALVECRRPWREIARGEAPDEVLDGKIFGGRRGDHRPILRAGPGSRQGRALPFDVMAGTSPAITERGGGS